MPYSARSLKGFTLIELLVTMTIGAFLMVAGTVALTDSRKNQTLKKAQMQLKVGLEQAKNNAFLGKKPSGCVSPFIGIGFNLGSPTSYTLTALCGASGSVDDIEILTENFKSGINVSSTDGDFMFKSVTGGTDLGPMGATFTVGLDGRTKTVIVSPSGDNAID